MERIGQFLLALCLSCVVLFSHAHGDWEEIGYTTGKAAMDNRSLSKPARNSIYSCNFSSMGNALSGRFWVQPDGTIYFLKKPFVKGSRNWNAKLSISESNPNTTITGNGLPSHATGDFPIDRSSTAYQYDRNPSSIRSQTIRYSIPGNPGIAEEPTCLPMGTIGIAFTGGAFFNALDAERRDAVANEIFDACEGHPQPQGLYHYHHNSPCFEQGEDNEHSPQVGYALDGFGIYGPKDEGGKLISNSELDECHGHVGKAVDRNGNTINEYHYHINNEFPYTLGCFKGEIEESMLNMRPPGGEGPSGYGGGREAGLRGGPSGGDRQGGPDGMRGGRPDLSKAAKQLGVSERDLMRALGPPPPDFRSAAQKLGVSERDLQEAMRPAGAP